MKRWIKIVVCSVFVLLLAVLLGLYVKTGFLNYSTIDDRDLVHWNYTEGGVIEGASEFVIAGDEEVCWLLIHGYTSTPDEMRELAFKLYNEFNDTIVVPRLRGHGEVPSKVLDLTLEDWYAQIENDYRIMDLNCGEINVVGFSFGGALATRLAEEEAVQNLYLLAPYFKARYNWVFVFKLEHYTSIFADWIVFTKKDEIAQLNSPEGLAKHVAYWNMPLLPVKYSRDFIEKTTAGLDRIEAPVLIQHSSNDEAADIKGAEMIFNNISSSIKELVRFTDSNHILTEDFDKQEVMQNIVDFEREQRL